MFQESCFRFFDHFELNTKLLDFYKSMKDDLSIHILTSDVIQDALELQPYWEGVINRIFSASKMGTHKSKPEAYERVLRELNLNPEKVIYIDDDQGNIDVSTKVGLQTILYQDNQNVISEVKKFYE